MRHLLKPFAILYIIYLRKRYKALTLSDRQGSQQLYTLRLLQAKIYYYHKQMSPWGYYHPSCASGKEQEKFMAWLFPPKDYDELELLTWSNPEAVTYYHNKIYHKQGSVPYNTQIKKQLIKWNLNY